MSSPDFRCLVFLKTLINSAGRNPLSVRSVNVKVYSTPTCSYCAAAKAFLRLIGVAFYEVDVAANQLEAQEMLDKSGQRTVPVIDVNGTIIVGFNREALLKTLRANGFSV